MTIVSEQQIARFRQAFFNEKTPALIKKGAKGLKPAAGFELDDQGRWVVPLEPVISFFFSLIQDQDSASPDRYLSTLYTLFSVFSRDLDDYNFVSEDMVSETDIFEAEDRAAIEFLTRNLIISFFNQVRETGSDRLHTLLDDRLVTLIRISGQGRNYRSLVENTLANLAGNLGREEDWRPCLAHMNTAALVCSLVGSRLPKVDKEVISKFIVQVRSEIEKELHLLDKIRNTRAQTLENPNARAVLKMTAKLDTALGSVLSRIEDFLIHARRFSRVIGIPLASFLGKHDDRLKDLLARQFLGHPDDPDSPMPVRRTYAGIRFSLTQLFEYGEITRFCSGLKEHVVYGQALPDIYSQYYTDLIRSVENMAEEAQGADVEHLRIRLHDFNRLFERFGTGDDIHKPEREKLLACFVSLFDGADISSLPDLMDLTPDFVRIAQYPMALLLKPIREKLLSGCHRALFELEFNPEAPEAFETDIRKTLLGYSVYYRPQRYFYQRFFDTYVGEVGHPPSSYLLEKARTDKALIISLLRFFSDARLMASLLPKSYYEHAAVLLEGIRSSA